LGNCVLPNEQRLAGLEADEHGFGDEVNDLASAHERSQDRHPGYQ
jgi:hypothetical protein